MSTLSMHAIEKPDEMLVEEVQEVISYRPHWLIRKGNTILLLIVIFFLSLTLIIKYPNTIKSSAYVAALNPPKLVIAKSEGKLMELFVANNQMILKGDFLGYLESTTNYQELLLLQKWVTQAVASLQNQALDSVISADLPSFFDLGELQDQYQRLKNQSEIMKQTISNGYYQKTKTSLQKDLQYLAALKTSAIQQKQLQDENKQLQEKEFKAYDSLAKDKVIAPLELNQYKSKLIAQEQNLKQLTDRIINNDINSHSKQKALLDLQKQVSDQWQQFNSVLLEVKSEIEKWIQRYVLTAPENGRVIFISSLQENEFISNGQLMFYIQPEKTKYYIEMIAGQQGLGKVKNGQKVIIKIDGYPSHEFGYLTATIEYISSIPNRSDSFLIKAKLPNDLKTNFGKTLYFRHGLTAHAEIITENKNLFDRLVGQLKEGLKK